MLTSGIAALSFQGYVKMPRSAQSLSQAEKSILAAVELLKVEWPQQSLFLVPSMTN